MGKRNNSINKGEGLMRQGSFTLPGEAGYEDLTLRLAKKWGADVIRDSDGTQLSDKITSSGYDIYSTICLVRADNEWAKANKDKLQQTFLMSYPVVAESDEVLITLLDGFNKEQLAINADEEPKNWWQVFDRTTGEEVAAENWYFDEKTGQVTIKNTSKWHRYTVNFLAYRIWEEISAYNHITNNWGDREHLMPIDPIHPEAQERILEYLKDWLETHPDTRVVRFTALFYNFWWLWGDDPKLKFIVNDWGCYNSAISAYAIREFEKVKGYRLTSEDFVTGGFYNNSYLPPSDKYRDWMNFIIQFVTEFGKKCVELVHEYDKKAYVFYNDHWIGMEPTLDSFKDFNFDGIIDGVFNGFETRKVASTKHVDVRELRLHPYLFPTGVNGAPTFVEGGNAKLEAQTYWLDIRRAILREKIDRIGFGGYLHLVEKTPDFVEYIEELADEFRGIKDLHDESKPYTAPFKVAILSAWGNQRAWGCRGHYNHGNYYNEVMETVSGMPLDIVFISFKDIVEKGIDPDIKVIINAGLEGDAWSGGCHWKEKEVIEALSEWIYQGGGFIGIGESSAVKEDSTYFKLAHILGVDREIGLTVGFDKYQYDQLGENHFITAALDKALSFNKKVDKVFVANPKAEVLLDDAEGINLAVNSFGKGRAVYMASHYYEPEHMKLLYRAIFWAAHQEELALKWTCSNPQVECAYYGDSKKLAVVNNSFEKQETTIYTEKGTVTLELEPCEMKVIKVEENHN